VRVREWSWTSWFKCNGAEGMTPSGYVLVYSFLRRLSKSEWRTFEGARSSCGVLAVKLP